MALGLNAPLAPSLFVAYDFDANPENAIRGVYGELGVGHPVRAGTQDVSLGAKVGLDYGYFVVNDAGEDAFGVAHVTLSATTSFDLGHGMALAPLAAVQIGTHEAYRASSGPTRFYAGLTLSL